VIETVVPEVGLEVAVGEEMNKEKMKKLRKMSWWKMPSMASSVLIAVCSWRKYNEVVVVAVAVAHFFQRLNLKDLYYYYYYYYYYKSYPLKILLVAKYDCKETY